MNDHETMLCEAAACAWEFVLDELHARDHQWTNYAKDVGYGQLRLEIIELAPLIDQDYNQIRDTYTYSFDWDYVPDWITANVTIDDDGLKVRPDRENPVK